MTDPDDAFVRATDNLIGLYRSVDRSTLDLPWLSFRPILCSLWASVKFVFLLYVGIFLIVPTNLVILVRNRFPGHWKYRPFFLPYLRYLWLWIWRGEAAFVPAIFSRPLLNVFIKSHFERRLRRLRQEILLHDGLSDSTRTTLTAHLDAALEQWKSPRSTAFYYALPVVVSFPGWYNEFSEFLGKTGIRAPADTVATFVSQHVSAHGLLLLRDVALTGLFYLLTIPITAFQAKRGLFIGRDSDKICFPGGQGGSVVYSKEREILNGVGIDAREAPLDLWILGISAALSFLLNPLFESDLEAWMPVDYPKASNYGNLAFSALSFLVAYFLIFFAAFRRRRAARA